MSYWFQRRHYGSFAIFFSSQRYLPPTLQRLLVAQWFAETSETLLENEAYMKEGAVEALEKALIFTIDAYSHSGLVSDNEIIQKLQDTLRHFKRRSISVPGSESDGIEAYVLVNCDLGLEEAIIKELLLVPEVTEVKGVFGVYDFIVKINTDSEEDVKRAIAKIRSMPVIKSSLTMMVIEAQAGRTIDQ